MINPLTTILLCYIFFSSVVHASDDITFLEARPPSANKAIGLLWSDKQEFSPIRNENYKFNFILSKPGEIALSIYSPDNDKIVELLNDKSYTPGKYRVEWDGRDDSNGLVPNEAWIPVFKHTANDGSITIDDPRRYSGGEIIPNLKWVRKNKKELSFDLPTPARVLIRVGVKDGPMMREISHWEPVKAGKVVKRWNGYDADGVDSFVDQKDIWVVLMAYQLTEFSVITNGNTSENYREYRSRKYNYSPAVDLSAIELQRNGVRLSRNHFLPRNFQPKVDVTFVDDLSLSRTGLKIVDDKLLLKVNVPKEDRWVLDSTFYETTFFIDYEFSSEEEQGFVPMIWELNTSDLAVGRHIATVQIFGFGGFISSDTVEFEKLQ